MKLYFILALWLLLTLPLLAQNEDQRYKAERFQRQQNHIEQILTYQLDLITDDSVLIERKFYNTQGQLLWWANYDPQGQLLYRGVLSYNSISGCLTGEIDYDRADQFVQQLVYECDENNNCIDYIQLGRAKNEVTHQASVYNRKGQHIRQYSYSKMFPSLHLIEEYSYDERSNLIAVYQVDGPQKTLRYSQKYNEQDQLTEKQYYLQSAYSSDGQLMAQEVDQQQFKYDRAKNLVEETTWSKGKLVKRIRYSFVKHS